MHLAIRWPPFGRALHVNLLDTCRALLVIATACIVSSQAAAQSACSDLFKPSVYSSHELDRLMSYAVTRSVLHQDLGGDRADQFRDTWAKHSLEEALQKYFPHARPIAILEAKKITFRAEGSPVAIVVDPLGNYFRIERAVKAEHGYQVFFDWNGHPQAANGPTHFDMRQRIAEPALSAETISTYTRLIAREDLNWHLLDQHERKALIEAMPFVSQGTHFRTLLRLAADSRDGVWIEPIDKMLAAWSRIEMGPLSVWRESATAYALKVRAELSNQRSALPFTALASVDIDRRLEALSRLDTRHLSEADVSAGVKLSSNTSNPRLINAFLIVAVETGSPEWISTFNQWSQQARVSPFDYYARLPEQIQAAKVKLFKKLVSDLKIGSNQPPSIEAAERFVRATVLMNDASTLPFLKTLEKTKWPSSLQSLRLLHSIKDAIAHLEA